MAVRRKLRLKCKHEHVVKRKKGRAVTTVYLDRVHVVEQHAVDELKAAAARLFAARERANQNSLKTDYPGVDSAITELYAAFNPWTIP